MDFEKIEIAGEQVVDWRPAWEGEDRERYLTLKQNAEARSRYIRNLRLHLGLKQSEVAELLGVTQSNVSKIENKPDATIGDLRKIVEGRGGKLRVIVEMNGASELELLT